LLHERRWSESLAKCEQSSSHDFSDREKVYRIDQRPVAVTIGRKPVDRGAERSAQGADKSLRRRAR
jgi:hypothetical protein